MADGSLCARRSIIVLCGEQIGYAHHRNHAAAILGSFHGAGIAGPDVIFLAVNVFPSWIMSNSPSVMWHTIGFFIALGGLVEPG